MDQYEESPQQFIADGAGQMTNTPPPLRDTPDDVATRSNVCVPVPWTMQSPPLLVSTPQHHPLLVEATTQHQIEDQEAKDQDLVHVQERLRLFWAKQMEEMKSTDLKNHSLPLAPIKRIMKADKDVRMVAKESAAVLSKACEMFILDITSRAWINTEEDARRIVQNKDIAAAIYKTDIFDFLEDVIPKDELREQIFKATNARQQVGSSIEPSIPCYTVPQQHGLGISDGTRAGGQQPPPFMPLYQPGPQNQQSFMPGSQQQPYMPWPRDQQTLEQQTMSWPQVGLFPDQQNPVQWSLPLPQAEQPYQQQSDD